MPRMCSGRSESPALAWRPVSTMPESWPRTVVIPATAVAAAVTPRRQLPNRRFI